MSTTRRVSDPERVAIVAGAPDARERAQSLGAELGLPVIAADPAETAFDLLLLVAADRLELREVGPGAPGAVCVDFVGGPSGFRRRSAVSKRQPIASAAGLRSGTKTVFDATAGLGQDTFLLASLGCMVTAAERSAVLVAMLRDGLARGRAHGDKALAAILDRIEIVEGDARDLLLGLQEGARPDVVYLDPMYEPRRKTTVVKKEMRVCRLLVGADGDAGELCEIARRVARRRVVVKRHRLAPPLAPDPVSGRTGTRVRYDVYPVGT